MRMLEAGLAHRVVGLERTTRLLEQARVAMKGLAFEGRTADFAGDAPIPPVDTALMLDVLYQLPTCAQYRLLSRAAAASARNILIRTPTHHAAREPT